MKALSVATLMLTLFLAGAQAGSTQVAESRQGVVRTLRLDASINPVVSAFVVRELAHANAGGDAAFLLELDTPGGLDSAMRDIIQAELSSQVPVIVYVYPSGARAASAGALIALAADFAVMAPGTNIGAAHPVAIGGQGGDEKSSQSSNVMTTKVVNDAVAYARSIAEQRGRNIEWAEKAVRESISTSASEALKLGVIDLVAVDEPALLAGLDGRSYRRADQSQPLRIAGARLLRVEMTWREEVLNTLSDPNIAYMLLMLGILGIFFEISQPGVVLPGAIGAIALLLALFAFQALPVNYAGVLLILLGVVLFVLEVKVVSFGMLTVGGVLALLLGSLMLIDSDAAGMQIALPVIITMVGSATGLMLLVMVFVVRTQRRRFVSGQEGMVGERGRTLTALDGHGSVFVHSERWDARCDEPVAADEEIEVVAVERDMSLRVRPVRDRQDGEQDKGER